MDHEKKLISLAIPCFNEEANLAILYKKICDVAALVPSYYFEILFIDNASTDASQAILKELAYKDKRVKVIINTRNFGQIASPYWGLMQTTGSASILIVSDLQEPPELILDFIKYWELGWLVVMAVKPNSKTNPVMHIIRRAYYSLLKQITPYNLVSNTTGFGLYDSRILDELRKISDPYPYLRGLVCELGFPIKEIEYIQPIRLGGKSKNNFYHLYTYAILGIVSHSLAPIRLASILGFFIGTMSFLTALIFITLKIMYWNSFPIGIAPIIISIFFLFGLLLIFIGIIGEYVGSVQTYLKKRPIVVESERINF